MAQSVTVAEAKDVVDYLCKRYPCPEELSKARLKFIVYLAMLSQDPPAELDLVSLALDYEKFKPLITNGGCR